jgi:hypothetical protein
VDISTTWRRVPSGDGDGKKSVLTLEITVSSGGLVAILRGVTKFERNQACSRRVRDSIKWLLSVILTYSDIVIEEEWCSSGGN